MLKEQTTLDWKISSKFRIIDNRQIRAEIFLSVDIRWMKYHNAMIMYTCIWDIAKLLFLSLFAFTWKVPSFHRGHTNKTIPIYRSITRRPIQLYGRYLEYGVFGFRIGYRWLPVRSTWRRWIFTRRGSFGSHHRITGYHTTEHNIQRKIWSQIFQ